MVSVAVLRGAIDSGSPGFFLNITDVDFAGMSEML